MSGSVTDYTLTTNIAVAKEFSSLAIQIWGFHIAGGLATLGWAASSRIEGKKKMEAIPNFMVCVALAAFLFSTAFIAYTLGERAGLTLADIKSILKSRHHAEDSQLNGLKEFNQKVAIVLVFILDSIVVVVVGFFFSGRGRKK
ncbi:MAG: hypothetical protein AAF607_13750 [Pseudomonadota bacterium]